VPMRVQEGAYKAGAMVRVSGNNIIISPPLVLTQGDADVILNALEAGLAGI
jgi:putrescine---pyruvate transaminase